MGGNTVGEPSKLAAFGLQYHGESKKAKRVSEIDSGGLSVRSGDLIRFSYGIPPVNVVAQVVQRGDEMIALTPGLKPAESKLRDLKKHVGEWFKV